MDIHEALYLFDKPCILPLFYRQRVPDSQMASFLVLVHSFHRVYLFHRYSDQLIFAELRRDEQIAKFDAGDDLVKVLKVWLHIWLDLFLATRLDLFSHRLEAKVLVAFQTPKDQVNSVFLDTKVLRWTDRVLHKFQARKVFDGWREEARNEWRLDLYISEDILEVRLQDF